MIMQLVLLINYLEEGETIRSQYSPEKINTLGYFLVRFLQNLMLFIECIHERCIDL